MRIFKWRDNNKREQLFISWLLAEHGEEVVRLFINNVNDQCIYNFHGNCSIRDIISESFMWNRTPEGMKYWEDIEHQWVTQLLG